MTETPEPIRKSLLPCTPPSEWEFRSVLGAPHGAMLIPNVDTGPVVVRRRVTWGDWEPVRPDHWAAEEPTDTATAGRAAEPVPAAHAGPCGQHCDHKADVAPASELRDLVAAAIGYALLPVMPRAEYRATAASHAATAVLAVRDDRLADLEQQVINLGGHQMAAEERTTELQQLRAEIERQIDAKVGITGQLGNALADKVAAEAELQRLREESPWLRATAEDLAAAKAAIDRVRALHRPVQYRGRPICVECSGYDGSTCDNGPQPHPCPTIAALDPQEPS